MHLMTKGSGEVRFRGSWSASQVARRVSFWSVPTFNKMVMQRMAGSNRMTGLNTVVSHAQEFHVTVNGHHWQITFSRLIMFKLRLLAKTRYQLGRINVAEEGRYRFECNSI